MKFVNRVSEIGFLERRFKTKMPEFIVIYGRRRIGKTEMLLRFAENKPYIYFMATETSEKDNLAELFRKAYDFFKDENLLALEKTWENLFRFISKKRIILIIDEFPYLVSQNKAIPSIFQKCWDVYLKNSKVFLVLAGSSIGMMEKYTLAYKSPLYGRRTGQWKVEPLKIKELFSFFPKYGIEDIINVYSSLDSIPGYLNKFDNNISFWENLKQNNLSKGSFLYDEIDFLLRQELREPKVYKHILKSIAFGNTKFGEIMSFTGMDKNKLFVYLDIMESLNITEKRIPVLDSLKSKMGRYYIKDNFFKFWFRYVLPNKSSLEEGKVDIVLKRIKNDYSNYIGRFVFEDVCKEFLWFIADKLPFSPEKIGNQWGSIRRLKKTEVYEIDLVALGEKEILFCECKWREKVDAKKIFEQLKEKAGYVQWNNNDRKEHYAIFAKSFKSKIKEPNLLLFDLKDMEKMIKSGK